MPEVVLALGSNLGDRRANLRAAVEELAKGGITVLRRSSVWETPPVPADQPMFLNAVLAADTELGPQALLDLAKRIESDLGRRPGRRWGPRPIDIDVLFYGETIIATETLSVPHPRIAERAFVLVPLSEVCAGPLPVFGETAEALLERLPPEAVTRVGPLLED